MYSTDPLLIELSEFIDYLMEYESEMSFMDKIFESVSFFKDHWKGSVKDVK